MKNNFKNIALIMILSIILLFTISLSTNSKVYANPKNSVSVEEQNKTKNSKSKQENLKKQNTTDEKKHISKQKNRYWSRDSFGSFSYRTCYNSKRGV
ncbi:hypothetical protein [Clostridium botulinum]|uniref:hypothetical protein n=1 Tax=Clostridium botulinum TaxID=1491 RepID=UPI000A883CE9|nr:hypothetical protein [Clostridium botulinum]